MLRPDKSTTMNSRGGLPVKNIVTAIFILLSVYLLYIYNVAQNRLHDAEMTGSRYRREAEEKANEIQGLISAKDDFQERSENEKRELNNRLKSLNQKHSMLQSQNTEIEADFMKLKQDMENLRMQHMQTESQHAQEYQTLKQTKEKEISDLTDELATMKSQNEELQNQIASLQIQVQNHETVKKNLLDQNAKLQMLQYQQQQQFELKKQNEKNAEEAKLLQQQQVNVISEKEKDQQNQQSLDSIFKGINNQDGQNVNLMSQDNSNNFNNNNDLQVKPAENNEMPQENVVKPEDQQAKNIDNLNAMNQAKPPSFNGIPKVDDEQGQAEENGEDNRPQVNPDDLQKGQILEPLKRDGGEVDVDGNMNVREVEERREREEMENQAAEHKDPLDLGQMEQPLGLGDHAGLGANDGKLGQQQPPVFVEQKQDDGNNEAALEDDQRQYYQNRGKEDEEEDEADDDDDINDNLDEDEEQEEAVDVNNNDRDKAVDYQLNAWQHFNMAPQPGFGGNNDNNNDDLDGGKYDDKEEEEEDIEEDKDVEEDDNNADDDYDDEQIKNHAAVQPIAPL